jgi:hypothetical protein
MQKRLAAQPGLAEPNILVANGFVEGDGIRPIRWTRGLTIIDVVGESPE